jgi:type II secretory ATPase GspE/PulE/Tfp pilus assembly ATPase PilB-like protein
MDDSGINKGIREHPSIKDFFPLPDGPDQYPMEYIENYSVIKLKENDELVLIGICDKTDVALCEYLKSFHRKPVEFLAIDRSELSVYLGKKMATASVSDEQDKAPDDEKLLLDKLANDAPVVNLVNGIFIEGIRAGASDIHIESFRENASVRYRVDGVLKRASTFERRMFPAVSSRIKIMANLNIMEKRLPQDGRITVNLADSALDMRVSIMPIADGESIVLRLLNIESTPLTLKELGFEPTQVSLLSSLALLPNGLLLATGPTGSGKTTTLKAMLRQIDAEEKKIITIEDPIEYMLDEIDQVQTNDKIGLTFESILRRVLRQDPDVIMVGEIRDTETAALAVRAALTGHLVFSTLHTNDSISAIARLRNMEIPSFLLAAVCRGVVAQRLVRTLCPYCKREIAPSHATEDLFQMNHITLKKLYEPVGCERCRNTGYKGRVAIVEMFTSSPELEEMIARDASIADITGYAQSHGMKSLITDALTKVARGDTSLSEIERTVMVHDNV